MLRLNLRMRQEWNARSSCAASDQALIGLELFSEHKHGTQQTVLHRLGAGVSRVQSRNRGGDGLC